jgi:hypothetical protein
MQRARPAVIRPVKLSSSEAAIGGGNKLSHLTIAKLEGFPLQELIYILLPNLAWVILGAQVESTVEVSQKRRHDPGCPNGAPPIVRTMSSHFHPPNASISYIRTASVVTVHLKSIPSHL